MHRMLLSALFAALLTVGTAAQQSATSAQPEPTPAPAKESAPDTPLAVVIESLKRANNDLDVRRNYTYQEREVEKQLDGQGNVKKTDIHTYDVVMVGGKHRRKLIAKDDQPLSEKESEKEEERMNKAEEKDTERARKHDAANDKEKEEERERRIIKEFSEVYNFSFAGEEEIDGEPAWIVSAVPIGSYQPHSLEARLLKCMQGKIWITKRDYRWVKIDAEMISDFNFGVFLAKLHKGMHIQMEQTRINNEVWLPKFVRGNMDARIAWHTARVNFETTFSNYKKFTANAKVTGVVATPNPPQ